MAHLTQDLKVEILGVTPRTKQLTPTEIVSLSAWLTFKGKSVKTLFQEIKNSEKDVKKTMAAILLNSALRGHASMATTPVLTLSFQGSKFIDALLTGMVFSSSLMASGRRTDTTAQDIVYPAAIDKNKKARRLYQQTAKLNIDFANYLLEQAVPKDEVSKILQYGLVGTGIISLSVESLISFKREYENEKEWLPQEAGLLLEQVEKQLTKLGLDQLWIARELAPRNIYPYPNIFKDPGAVNLARLSTPGAIQIDRVQQVVFTDLKKRLHTAAGEKDWFKRLLAFRKISRDYNLALAVTVASRVPWRVWGEKKRHRTVPMVVDSIYYAIDTVINKLKSQIRQPADKTTAQKLKLFNQFFSVPPTIKNNAKYLEGWLSRLGESVNCYQQLLALGIKPRDAIFVIPRGIYLNVLQRYDLYNLLFGYYPLRLCSTAEEEMLRLTETEVKEIKKQLQGQGLGWLGQYLVPKCHLTGFCPERNFCGKILKVAPKYNLKIHHRQHAGLKQRFSARLRKIGT